MPGYQNFSAFAKGLKEIRYGYSFLLMQKFEFKISLFRNFSFWNINQRRISSAQHIILSDTHHYHNHLKVFLVLIFPEYNEKYCAH